MVAEMTKKEESNDGFGPQWIKRLVINNTLRIEAFDHSPKVHGLVILGGKNAQGKTSVLNAIEMVLTGKKAIPPEPIRRGARKGRIMLETEDLILTRVFTARHSTIDVRGKDGRRYSSPQTLLERLYDARCVDVLAFPRMKPKEQAEWLIDLVGIRDALTESDQAIEARFQDRRDRKRDLGQAQAQLQGLKYHPAVPAEPVSVGDLVEQLRQGRQKHERKAEIERQSAEVLQEARQAKQQTEKDEARIEQLRQEIGRLEAGIRERKAHVTTTLKPKYDQLQADIQGLGEMPDLTAIEQQLERTQQTNAQVEDNKRHTEAKEGAAALEDLVQEDDSKLEELREHRRATLAAAKMPLADLAIDVDGNVTWKGLPFEQASQAEQLRVALAIAVARKPKFKIALIRDASVLDPDHVAELRQWAEEHEWQVWVECVETEGASVVIEDGHIREAA